MAPTDVRETVRQAMAAAGRPDRAALASDTAATTISELSVPILRGWRLLRFDAVPHPGASFYVAVGPAGVLHLTEEPASFTKVLQAANVTPTSAADAAALARAYVETTRPMTELVRVVGDVDDILWVPRPTPDERRARERASVRLRPVLRPPDAVEEGGSWVATVFVQRGDTVERRTVTIGADRSLTERGKVMARDLPVPYVA
ncbi:hypothetical protein [Actinomadura sp. HBU206391]|uniref:hypothetical protein n=1 Tax=Actinomadura sp. HBU206391 TaxID=2731692 RepID=UPI00164F367F|nr:hypothetical protein [Actinomadura sp. HBU206391]MBC6457531.1 hypothetical protein [Actinomadura sp. HBU206391]